MQRVTLAAFGVLVAALITSGFGCELVSSVDRSKIPEGAAGQAGTGGGGTGGQPTTGGGGTGGGGTSGSGGGGTGGTMACTTPADCGNPPGDCVDNTCEGMVCGTAPKAMGAPATTQIPGDCKVNQCDGQGNVVPTNDDTDAPDDGNECTGDVCAAGVPSNPALGAGSMCMTGGAVCDGAGACVQCVAPTDCPGQDTECQSRTCDAGKCGVSNAAQGTAVATQTAGDCLKNQCDGSGAVESVPDDLDPLNDGNDCTTNACNNGMMVVTNVAIDTPCGQNLALKCDGAGKCVGCNTDAQCGTPANACLVAKCVANACSTVNKADGTACNDGDACSQTDSCVAGACTGQSPVVCSAQDQCHDSGACNPATGQCSTPAKSDGAACSDGNGCTQTDTCQAGACTGNNPVTCAALDQCHTAGACNPATGVCSNPPVADGSACTDGNACTQADTCQAGACVGASPVVCGAPDQCHVAGSCNPASGTCSNPPKADGSACSDGNACTQADTCQAGSCTGGAPVTCAAQDQCHVAGTCSAATGTCSNPAAPNGTSCTNGGAPGACSAGVCTSFTCSNGMKDGIETDVDCGGGACPTCVSGQACNVNGDCQSNICNGGICVQCVTAAQCPGMDTECQARTCNSNTCGMSNTAAGTALASQTSGDCQQKQCDGAGGITSVANNADVPADDGNQCTTEVCNAGVPAHPAAAINTACTQNGGSYCSAIGVCVACNAASQCPGMDTECQTRTCSGAGACGTSNAAAGTACSQNGGTACDGAGACTQPTPDIFVLRVGDGSAALSGAATAGFIEERNLMGALVVKANNPLALPTAVNGSNRRLTFAGSSTAEGSLSRSADGHYVTMAGYDADVGTATVASSPSSTTNRIVGRVDKNLAVNTSTRLDNAFSAGNVRAATSLDGSAFWVAGSNGGVHYALLGMTGSTQILANPTSLRVLHIFGNQLYGSSGSGTFTNVFTIGSGLPTMSGATATSLPGLPTSTASPYSFVLFDLNANVAGYDTLYVADDRAVLSGGGVQKWTYDGTTWTLAKTFANGITTGVRGLAGFVSGGTNVTLVATTTTSNANALVLVVDDGSANPAFTTIATAPTNTAFRGVAIAPN